jgi:sugar/nucleoside kinase (ribokinase family)
MTSKVYDVVYIGNYTKDTIIHPVTGTTYVDGGGAHYAAQAAACLGFQVALVTRLARADEYVVEKVRQTGVDCLVDYSAHSTLMQLEYPTTNPDIRTLTVKAVADPISAASVAKVRAKSAVIGSSLRGEVGMDVIQSLKRKNMVVAADMQGFVRVLRSHELKYEAWGDMRSTLAAVDVVKSDAVEAEFLTGETDIYQAAKFYAALGPREIVLTHKDGVLIYADGEFHNLGFYPARLDGRSGRGDTCIGSYMAMRLVKSPLEAGIWAAAVTSLKMEKLGPFNRPLPEVEAFIRIHYNHGSQH